MIDLEAFKIVSSPAPSRKWRLVNGHTTKESNKEVRLPPPPIFLSYIISRPRDMDLRRQTK